jgi:hypothetical protein
MSFCWTGWFRSRIGADEVPWLGSHEEGLVPLALVRRVVETHGSGSSSLAYWSTAVTIRGDAARDYTPPHPHFDTLTCLVYISFWI